MTKMEEAGISFLGMCPGDFRNTLLGLSRPGKGAEMFDLSEPNPEKLKENKQNLQSALEARGYKVNLGDPAIEKLLRVIQRNRPVTVALAAMLAQYEPAYSDEGDHPPEETGRELLRVLQQQR